MKLKRILKHKVQTYTCLNGTIIWILKYHEIYLFVWTGNKKLINAPKVSFGNKIQFNMKPNNSNEKYFTVQK